MTSLAKRVAKARKQKGWSQKELARQLSDYREGHGKPKVKQQSINQLELSEVANPRYLYDLAKVLEIDYQWLIGEGGIDETRHKVIKAPLISWVQAGELADAVDPYHPGDAEDWVPVTYQHDHLIALRVRGNSMNKIAPDSSIIIIDLNDRNAVDGKHYIFRHEGTATFKTYRSGPPVRLVPTSTDERYKPIKPSDGVEVVGRVIQKTESL